MPGFKLLQAHQARKDALAALEKLAWEAVGRRRISSDVRAKITKVVEALLAGSIDLELVTQLFGGIAPARNRATVGFEEGDGTWGKMSVKADIKQALLFAFSLVRTVHRAREPGADQATPAVSGVYIDDLAGGCCDDAFVALEQVDRAAGAPLLSMPAAELFTTWAVAEAAAAAKPFTAVIAVGDCDPAAHALDAASSATPQM